MIIRQRVFPNVGHGDGVWIWESSIVYEVLYLIFVVEAIVDFTAKFLWKWQYSLRFQVGGIGLGIGVGSKGLMNPLEVKFSYAWAKVIPKYDGTQIHGVKSFRSGHSFPICLLD